MKKIDFFGGLHGHYLELVLNVSVFQNNFDISRPMFKDNGACHVALLNYENEYQRIIKAGHYSFFQVPFNNNDQVVRITCEPTDMLIAIINSFVRAGEQSLDLGNLEYNTLEKLNLPKTQDFKKTLISDFGIQQNYPRSALRNYFQSMFQYSDLGHSYYNNFDKSAVQFFNFPLRSMFTVDEFYYQLNLTASWFNENFYPTTDLYNLHREFVKINHGYNSELKCKQILSDIIAGKQTTFSTNIVEEAWINHRIAETFRCYDLDILYQDNYPTDTAIISHALYNWKAGDIWSPGQDSNLRPTA